jgi:hypothetical protein
MASKITIKRSQTAAAPAGLSFGEMAFVQGSGLTANQLYVGISGGSPVWVGAQIPSQTTGTWTDTAAKTTLATQFAINDRISSLITSNTSGVASVNGLTGAVINVALTTNPLSQFAATTSSQLLGVISDETGTGSLVFATNPTLSGVTLGAATATSINKVAITRPFNNATITIGDDITFTVASQNVTLNGSGIGSNVTVPATGTLSTLAGAETLSNKTLSGVTLGTPASGTLTNCTGLPVGTGISGLGTNVANFLATPNSANFASALTDETGSNVVVFGTSPAITTSLTTPSTGFDLLNTTATTVNFAGGASSALNIGNVGGTAAFAGSVTVAGNLTVNGTTTNINTTNLVVEDKNIVLGDVATPSDATANGGGISLLGASTKTLNWVNSGALAWTSSENFDLLTGKAYYINGTSVLNSSALGAGITGSSLTQVGTITSGTWSGSFGAVSGANLTNLTAGNLSGTIPSAVLGNSTVYIGTTAVALNRTTASLALTGISIDGNAGTATTATNVVATEQTSGTIFLVGVASASASTGLLVNATPSTALTYDVTSGELSATLIDGGTF